MDIFNPLKEVCRGVEADILNHLIHHPSFRSPAEITRAIGRSRSETLKCLHFLADAGVISQSPGSGRAYGIHRGGAIGSLLLKFAELPQSLASELKDTIEAHGGEFCSVVLAPENWGVLLGRRNLVVMVHHEGGSVSPYLYRAMIGLGRRRFNADIDIISGIAADIRAQLERHGIETWKWPLSPATKGPHHVSGEDLLHVLGGTGGI